MTARCQRHWIMSLDEKAWQAARERIGQAARAAGRDPATVRLLAVSKTQPAQAVREAWGLGQRAFGENYVQEAAAKRDALAGLEGVEWRLIGPLQSNKAALAADVFVGRTRAKDFMIPSSPTRPARGPASWATRAPARRWR